MKEMELNMEEKYIEKIIVAEQRSKSNTKRLDTLESKLDNIYELTVSVKEIATEMKAMREDVNKIDKRVVEIENKPAKKLDSIWGYIIGGLIGAIITFLTIKLGLK